MDREIKTEALIASESSPSKDWLKPEENKAWAELKEFCSEIDLEGMSARVTKENLPNNKEINT